MPSARLIEIPGLGHALPGSLHRRIVEAIVEHITTGGNTR